ncbi:DUF2855 family protein [Aspergillus puulaauensis]|uniref:Uncharacterized protein n=1 Tax=Aspergillus puulaauensis TaxID=1220207 RepID=A0A7R8AH55_9EURO|nr:uncharacterized protein APUU_10900A [Aspergillus puulaauensis]BCS18072.1 hypothetical protein APUU_10900A [Aspergillus puulaauensis]
MPLHLEALNSTIAQFLMEVHVVSKADNQKHAVAALDTLHDESHSLASSSVRVWPLLIALTSNNLSYARGGDLLHWWDTYPVPAALSAPYNDQKSWGIVPAWGFGVVTESSTDISRGTLLWGFWPTANIPVSLQLQPSKPKGYWAETSESRQRLMTIYNIYSEEGRIDLPETMPTTSIASLLGEDTLNRLAWTTLFRPIWQTGYLLSRHTFTSSPASLLPVHPLGIDRPWTATDADISAAVVISLSASSKTARSFAYHMFRRSSAEERPLGFLQVSQTPELLEAVPEKLVTDVPAKAVKYEQVGEAMEWIGGLKPARIVLVDFGARAGTLVRFVDAIEGHSNFGGAKTTIVNVGSEQKVYSTDDIKENRASMQTMGKIQFNTSAVRDTAIRQTSADDYYAHVQPVWDDWLRVSHDIMPDIRVTLGWGVSGEEGIERGWSRLCQGSVDTQEGLVYTM